MRQSSCRISSVLKSVLYTVGFESTKYPPVRCLTSGEGTRKTGVAAPPCGEAERGSTAQLACASSFRPLGRNDQDRRAMAPIRSGTTIISALSPTAARETAAPVRSKIIPA
jgi:hypothetical protein